jgi:cellulose synthase/poly-beta-1,6-N-acetylglucosamine synthase-like glycosyltransferase
MLIIPFTFSIDAATYIGKLFKNRLANDKEVYVLLISPRGETLFLRMSSRKFNFNSRPPNISVIVPAYNEEETLIHTVISLFNQTLRPRKVIVVDDCSTDQTPQVCNKLGIDFGEDFIYIRRNKNSGKASNINYIVKEFPEALSEITVINDSDTIPHKTCLETLARNFISNNVAAVTPYGYTTAPDKTLARALHYGNAWNNRIFKFRKKAQGFRGGISVVCGACTAYKTEVLQKLPIPERTKTEDTDYTWILQENGYTVIYDEKALAYSRDLKTARALMRQWFRWYSGILQSIYIHGRQLLKARKMFWTTVLPALIESVPYSFGIVTLPLVAVLNLTLPEGSIPYFNMNYVRGFLIADFLFTTVPTAIISPKYLLRLPQIYFYKYVASALTVSAYLKTTYEKITRQQNKWSNVWSRRQV